LPISQRAPAKNDKFFAGELVDIPINTKRLVRISLYPCKIDLVIPGKNPEAMAGSIGYTTQGPSWTILHS